MSEIKWLVTKLILSFVISIFFIITLSRSSLEGSYGIMKSKSSKSIGASWSYVFLFFPFKGFSILFHRWSHISLIFLFLLHLLYIFLLQWWIWCVPESLLSYYLLHIMYWNNFFAQFALVLFSITHTVSISNWVITSKLLFLEKICDQSYNGSYNY